MKKKDVARCLDRTTSFQYWYPKGKVLEFTAIGQGQIDVRLDNPDGELIASTFIDGNTSTSLLAYPEGTHDLVFIMKGETLLMDKWKMK